MRILVTGGSGFIGSVLITKLLAHGHDVLNVDLVDSNNVSTEVCSIANSTQLEQIVSTFKPDAVFHLAALHFIPYCEAHPKETVDTNILGTANLLLACSKISPLPKIILASSAAVYAPSESPHQETDPLQPIDIYGETKVEAEKLANTYSTENNVPVIVCRFSNVYGPNNPTPHVIPSILKQLSEGTTVLRLGIVDSLRDFIHVQDVTDALLQLLDFRLPDNTSYTTYNISSGKACSIGSLADTILDKYNKATGSEIRLVSENTLRRKNDRHALVLDNSQIKNDLGWEPKITLEDAVATLVSDRVSLATNK